VVSLASHVIKIYCRIFLSDGIISGIIKYDGSPTPQIDRTISKKLFILFRKDVTSLDRLADSTASPFATLQLLDYCLSRVSLFCSLSLSLFLSAVPFAVVLFLPKSGATS
jgi:hypothetical protein